jgi:hypothetical protein
MKKVAVVLSLFVVMTVQAQTGPKRTVQELVGMWRNKSGAGLDIVDSNTVYIVRGHQRKLAFATLSDVHKSPATFTLTVKDSFKITTLKSLLLLVKDDVLQWQLFDSETRPVSFSYRRGDMLFLKRIDRLTN